MVFRKKGNCISYCYKMYVLFQRIAVQDTLEYCCFSENGKAICDELKSDYSQGIIETAQGMTTLSVLRNVFVARAT